MDENSFRNAKLRSAWLVAYKAGADLAGKGSIFIITVVAARRLPPQAFGIFSLASTLGWMLAVATDFGIQLHVAREVARAPERAPDILGAWLRVRWWTTAAAIVALIVGLVATQATLAFALPMLLFALVYGGSGLIEFLHYFYRGLSRSDVESTLTVWQRSATLMCGVVALLWRPNVSVLAIAMLLPVATTLALSLQVARRIGRADRPARHSAPPSAQPPAVQPPAPAPQAPAPRPRPRFLRDVFPIGAGIVLSALYFRVDLFLVQAWSGTEAVALYNAVFRVVEALRLFPAAVLAVALPALCRAADARPLARVSAGVTSFAIVVALALWATAGWTIPLLYGAPYAAAVPAFRILLLSFPLLSLNYALTHQLVGWNGQRAYAAVCALALVANLALNARLIPALSIEGAAWATLGTELCLTCGCLLALMMSGAPAAAAASVPA